MGIKKRIGQYFFNSFLEKGYIKDNLLERGYIKKEGLTSYLVHIKEEERRNTTDELTKKFDEDKDRLREEHLLEMEEKNAEIVHLHVIIEDMKQRVKDAEKVYTSSMKGMRTNLRISSEIGYSVKRLLDNSTAIFAAFQSIQDQSEEHQQRLLTEEKINRKLLRIDQKINGLKK